MVLLLFNNKDLYEKEYAGSYLIKKQLFTIQHKPLPLPPNKKE